MGLDNGIRIKGKNPEAQRWLLEYAIRNNIEIVEGGEVEIAYWRKYWNVRAKIEEMVKGFKVGDDTPLTFVDLVTITHICEGFITKKYNWEDNRGCLWEWIHGVKNLAQIVIDINSFLADADYEDFEEDDFEIYFYDSF